MSEKGLKIGQVAVLDIGSSKIKAVIGERGVNKTFVIKGECEQEYAGFYNGLFFDTIELKELVKESLITVMNNCGVKVDTLYIGVPGDWCSVVVREHRMAYQRKRKITDEVLDEMYNSAYNVKSDDYQLINRAAMYYVLDDNRRVASAIGQVTESLKGVFSFILCEKYFIDIFSSICNEMGIANVEYVAISLAEASYLFSPEIRDRMAILLDCGYTSTTLSIIQGDGLLYQKSFAFGGGFITAQLADKLGIDVLIAERLKRKVNLSCEYTEDDCYKVYDGSKEYEYSSVNVNNIVDLAISDLCENIEMCLVDSRLQFPEYIPISLTGGGVSYMRGIKEAITNRVNMATEIIFPNTPYMNKPIYSSMLSLLDVALSQGPQKVSFFKKIFGF